MIRSRLIFALLSPIAPFATVVGVLLYQSVVGEHSLSILAPNETVAVVFKGFSDSARLVIVTWFGCIVGLLLAGLSLSLKRRRLLVSVLAYAGLVVNGLPL